ncbi:hypothetical protein N1851_002079 [Merluccius polli]|uniref:Uncharacterized protein n=1 Tax=Merluccius polli TaxID=89951 RepID=A0AA47P924_MERPO|nr:hypothetical protein N1851_002079 [Merluccius polli]
MTFKARHGLAPPYIADLLSPYKPGCRLRSSALTSASVEGVVFVYHRWMTCEVHPGATPSIHDVSFPDSSRPYHVTLFWKKTNLISLEATHTIPPDVYISGEKLQVVTEYKYLGIIIDSGLSFKSQVKRVCDRVKFSL